MTVEPLQCTVHYHRMIDLNPGSDFKAADPFHKAVLLDQPIIARLEAPHRPPHQAADESKIRQNLTAWGCIQGPHAEVHDGRVTASRAQLPGESSGKTTPNPQMMK